MAAKTQHFHIFRSSIDNQWYWRLVARNGRTIATGAEGYKRKSGAVKDVEHIQNNVNTNTTSVTVEE